MEVSGIGKEGQEKIKKTKILVIGSGGIGTAVMQNLSAIGIGTIGIVDNAMVEESNIARQCLYGTSDLGKQKAIITKQKLQEINAQSKFNIHNLCISFENLENISSEYNFIVDASNSLETGLAIWNHCAQYNKPLIYARVNEFKVDIGFFTNPVELYAHIEKRKNNKESEAFMCPVASFAASLVSLEILKWLVDIPGRMDNMEKNWNLAEF